MRSIFHSCPIAMFISVSGCSSLPAKVVPSNPLVGVWKIEEFCDVDTNTGRISERFGPRPIGYFIYAATGQVSIQIMAKPNERHEGEYIGYFGTYSIDVPASTVTHHVEGGTLPDYIATDQVRKFRITGQTLSIGLDPPPQCRVLRKVQ